MADKTIILIDGENLLLRYNDMCASGATPKSNVIHKPDAFVWKPDITEKDLYQLIRVSYYTTYVGDDAAIDALSSEIASLQYKYNSGQGIRGEGTVNPHVYKKSKKSAKTKSVDINISIDALRHTYNGSIEKLLLVSGDGDYLPLIQEVMRQGITVRIGAFSNGCHPALKFVPDDFLNLDELFFEGQVK